MSAFTVEDQERQRKMNKMTDGKCLKVILGDVQRHGKIFWMLLIFFFLASLYFGNLPSCFYNPAGLTI